MQKTKFLVSCTSVTFTLSSSCPKSDTFLQTYFTSLFVFCYNHVEINYENKGKHCSSCRVNRCHKMLISVSADFPSTLKTWSYDLRSGLYCYLGQNYSWVWSFPIRLEKSSNWFNFSVAGEIQSCTGTSAFSYLSLTLDRKD